MTSTVTVAKLTVRLQANDSPTGVSLLFSSSRSSSLSHDSSSCSSSEPAGVVDREALGDTGTEAGRGTFMGPI